MPSIPRPSVAAASGCPCRRARRARSGDGALYARKFHCGPWSGLCRLSRAATSANMSGIPNILGACVNFALPPRCAGCGQIVAADRQLCVDCWQALDFLTGRGCASCGDPNVDDGQICLRCMADPPLHDGVRAAVAYGDMARTIILRLKHGRRTGLVPLVAKAMTRLVDRNDAILVPVPLHRWRIWSRGFNQSALIARALAKLSGAHLCVDGLKRVRATPLLRGLGARARARAVSGVFAVNPEYRPVFKGRTVFLVDDVFTSGATTNACARQLKRAGAARVIVLCWARVVRDDGMRD